MVEYKSTVPEIGLTKKQSGIKKVQIKSSRDGAEYARQFYFEDIGLYESMFLILMNQRNNTIGWVKISQGGVSGTVADIRLIAKYAIESLASSVMLVHNHPSGDTRPSQADINLTKKVAEGLRILDIRMLDHLILGEDDSYLSLADEGLF